MVRAMSAAIPLPPPPPPPPPPRYGERIALAALIVAVALLIPALTRSDDVRAQTPANDRAALEALYDATGGSGWTTGTNWKTAFSTVHTFKLTAATLSGVVGYAVGLSTGTVRESSGSVTLNGRAYELLQLYYTPGTTGLDVEVRRTPLVLSDFTGLSLRIGTTTLALADATANTFGGTRRHWAWTGAPSGLIANGNFDAHLLRVVALGAWHGVTTNGAGRVTALDLSSNGLSGAIPAAVGRLTALTSLDLSGNAGLRGSIPSAWTDLTALTALDLSGTGVCAPPDDAGVTAWLAGIRTAGGTATVDVCAVPPPPPSPPAPAPAPVVAIPLARVTLGVDAEGDAPEGAAWALRLECGNTTFTPTLAAGETYTASVMAGAVCSLSVTDRQDATEVRGEFADRAFDAGAYAVTVTLVHAEPEPEPAAPEPNEQLERELTAGAAFVHWRGAETPVAEAVAGLTPRVVAVHRWDAPAQAWRSWFPDGEALGANTLAAFETGGIYFVSAE